MIVVDVRIDHNFPFFIVVIAIIISRSSRSNTGSCLASLTRGSLTLVSVLAVARPFTLRDIHLSDLLIDLVEQIIDGWMFSRHVPVLVRRDLRWHG
jgi:hypothetical protein